MAKIYILTVSGLKCGARGESEKETHLRSGFGRRADICPAYDLLCIPGILSPFLFPVMLLR
jgi:hypothetical protein